MSNSEIKFINQDWLHFLALPYSVHMCMDIGQYRFDTAVCHVFEFDFCEAFVF